MRRRRGEDSQQINERLGNVFKGAWDRRGVHFTLEMRKLDRVQVQR